MAESKKLEKEANQCFDEVHDKHIKQIVRKELEKLLEQLDKKTEPTSHINKKTCKYDTPLELFMDITKGLDPEKMAEKCQEENQTNQGDTKTSNLSSIEKAILKSLNKLGWSWITIDSYDDVEVHQTKPERSGGIWVQDGYGMQENLNDIVVHDVDGLFTFLKHDTPVLIANLIRPDKKEQ